MGKFLKKFPASISLFNLIGAANQAIGNPKAAISAYENAINIAPDHAISFNNLISLWAYWINKSNVSLPHTLVPL